MALPETASPIEALPRTAGPNEASSIIRRFITSPNAALALVLVAVCPLVALPLSMPIGPSYWDLYQYYDAANRIFSGQVPINDFSTVAGPLSYYLFAGWLVVFPDGQGALLAQWSTFTVTAPLMALILWDVGRRSRATAFALLIPFLLFALLPFNVHEYYPLPGTDTFGIYNRQGCQLLYVIVAAIMFMRRRRALTAVITIGMSALFFIKITGFVAGGLIAAYAFFAGRLRFKNALAAGTAFLLLLTGLQITSGLVGNYIGEILKLVGINNATLAPWFLRAASQSFGILVPTGLLALLLLWTDRRRLISGVRLALRSRSAARASAVLDHPGLWLLLVLFAGILYETQNYGSQALIYLWPVCLRVLTNIRRFNARPVIMVATATLVAAAMLPPVVNVSERAARALVGSAKNVPLANHNLKSLGAVSMRPEVAVRVERMLAFYPDHRSFYDDFVDIGQMPSPLLNSDMDFQMSYLATIDQAIDAIRQFEAETGVHFETIMPLELVNPFPWLMDRSGPRGVSIAADPLRTVTTPGTDEKQAVGAIDLVLYPTCPPTVPSSKLLGLYSEALANHRRIKLSECYDAFVHPKFISKLGH
jgi:hypothetical protein